jgi:hypothetical protein
MEHSEMVTARDFCSYHRIEISFIETLNDYGLIEIRRVSEEIYLVPDQLARLEKILSLHFQMDINLEGIQAIENLLTRMEDLQHEIVNLKNKLSFYE